MQQYSGSDICIKDIIENERIVTYFQPIVSLKRKSMIGVEALSRGIVNGKLVTPGLLFELSEKENLTVELDRLCRKKALEAFVDASSKDEDLILFINMDTSIIDKGVVGSRYLINMVSMLKINPNNIAIEINETKVNDMHALQAFIDVYRGYGFIIALDDVGAGYSNLNRLAAVKPDIVKVDMALIRDIDKEFFKQEILKSLVGLARNIGSLVIAEGIEREGEAITVMDIGVGIQQGYYYAKPVEAGNQCCAKPESKIQCVVDSFKDYIVNKSKNEKALIQGYDALISEFAQKVTNTIRADMGSVMEKIVRYHSKVECVYILDGSGIQISDTICNYCKHSKSKRAIFFPAPKGTDHSLKKYYYKLTESGLSRYITEPYISLASGSLCITISMFFKDNDGNDLILCMDVNYK